MADTVHNESVPFKQKTFYRNLLTFLIQKYITLYVTEISECGMGKKKIQGGSAFSPFSSPFYLYMVRVQTVATPRLKGVSTAPGWQIYTQISTIKEAKQSYAPQVLLGKIHAKTAAISLSGQKKNRRVTNICTRNCAIKNTEYEVSFISIHTLIYIFNSKSHEGRQRKNL
jgi:hypothetical protein